MGTNSDWEKIKTLIWESARAAGITKKVGNDSCCSNFGTPNTFSKECRQVRNEIWKHLKDWVKDRSKVKKEILNK